MNPAEPRILASFGVTGADLVGVGGESNVYALGADRILRIPRSRGPDAAKFADIKVFLDGIAGRLPFATPAIEEIASDGSYVIEKRLRGRAMSDILLDLDGERRRTAFGNYVAAIDAIGTIALPDRPYGHLLAPAPVTADDWPTFARRNLERFLKRNRATIAREAGDPDRLFAKALDLSAALPALPPKVLVHGDYFTGNVLLDDRLEVSAVIDFGVYTVVGDRTLDFASAYFPCEVTRESRPQDAGLVRDLLVERHGSGISPAIRFYRALFAFEMADPAYAAEPYPKLFGWSIAMLKALSEDRLPT
jgi:aminoglycoside phosphotransferase (APT) family kinase protein